MNGKKTYNIVSMNSASGALWEARPRFRVSDATFHGSLMIFGLLALILLLFTKTNSAHYLGANSFLYFYTYFITIFELSRLSSAIFYDKIYSKLENEGADPSYEPTVSFVIPCKNEEKAIANTIEQCFLADWPENKLEVIVINDGSTDGTLEVIMQMKKKHDKLIVIDWKENRGKRYGMAEGFRRAIGEIVIQLDSDSYIDPKTFRNLIRPFSNPRIGAVCAHADPENANENLLTRMQAAYYFESFRILKAAESTFFTVFCCSGCSSAYRKDIVLPIMDAWLNETFLGKPVTWGDDRALTTWVLRQGYDTIYSKTAKAFTIVPENLRQLFKQQVRWKKSWFINAIFTSGFIARKRPFVAFTYFFPLMLISFLTPFMAAKAVLFSALIKGGIPLYYFFGIFLMSFLFVIYYRLVDRKNKYWPYVFLWAGFNSLILSYVLFYALFRLNDRKWGTR